MAHIHEKIDITATAYIVFQNKVLLRMHDKYNKWLAVGGHVELDEDPNQAIIREIKEEVGLDVKLIDNRGLNLDSEKYKELIPPRFMNIHYVNETHRHMDMIYFVNSNTDKVEPGGDDQSPLWKWFMKQELYDPKYNLDKPIVYYAETALSELS